MGFLKEALLANLLRDLAQRSNAEAAAQRDARVLRIALADANAPDWPGPVVALMWPAPPDSPDALWANRLGTAQRPAAGPQALRVEVAAGASFNYGKVQGFARALLHGLAQQQPAATSVGLALPGPAFGLDVGACVEWLLLGLVETLAALPQAPGVTDLVLLEPSPIRRQLMADKLALLLAADQSDPSLPGWVPSANAWPLVYLPVGGGGGARMKAPFEQRTTHLQTLTAFVAMPFKTELLDVYQYGILGPAEKAKFRAERLDFEHYTGDVVQQIKDRIDNADLVIADMSGANANVFLEIGYAWGKGRQVVLLWRKPADGKPTKGKLVVPPFDVAGSRRIEYSSIRELDRDLTETLKALYPLLRQRSAGQD